MLHHVAWSRLEKQDVESRHQLHLLRQCLGFPVDIPGGSPGTVVKAVGFKLLNPPGSGWDG